MKTEIQHTLPHTGETYTYHVALELAGGRLCVAVEYPEGALEGSTLTHTEAYPVGEIERWASEVAGFAIKTDGCYHYGAGRVGHVEELWALSAEPHELTTREIYDLDQRTEDAGLWLLCDAALFEDDVDAAVACFRAILAQGAS